MEHRHKHGYSLRLLSSKQQRSLQLACKVASVFVRETRVQSKSNRGCAAFCPRDGAKRVGKRSRRPDAMVDGGYQTGSSGPHDENFDQQKRDQKEDEMHEGVCFLVKVESPTAVEQIRRGSPLNYDSRPKKKRKKKETSSCYCSICPCVHFSPCPT